MNLITRPDEVELTRRLACGDESAFLQLYKRYFPRLLHFATGVTGSRAIAEELVDFLESIK